MTTDQTTTTTEGPAPMTEDQTYNGWTNRETWAAALHLDNDQGLYHQAQAYAESALHEAYLERDDLARIYGEPVGSPTVKLATVARASSYCADSLAAMFDEWAADVADAAAGRPGSYPVCEAVIMALDEVGSRHRVDWRHVAEGYLEEVLEDPDGYAWMVEADEADEAELYEVVRFYAPDQGRTAEVLRSGLTREEAEEHCNDPATREDGVYFDGFRAE